MCYLHLMQPLQWFGVREKNVSQMVLASCSGISMSNQLGADMPGCSTCGLRVLVHVHQ